MESKLARIVKTLTFRLALVYVGLFSLSVILLFTFIYIFAMNYLETQAGDAIHSRYNYLLKEYRDDGSSGIEDRINGLIEGDDEGIEIYLLVNSKYEKLAGNLNEWPEGAAVEAPFEKNGNWVRFHIESLRGDPEGIEVKAVMVPISKWRWLLIGQSMQGSLRVEQTIVQTFWASLALTVLMAFIGALIMTRSVTGRLSIINRSTNAIMQGNLSARVPFAKGGDEFDELSMNLNRMLDKIEMLLLSLSQFASNIAHDLRSPLNRIINRLEAGLRSLESRNPAYKLLEMNIRDMEDLVGTFNSILKISELEAAPDFRHFEPCDLAAIIGNLAEFYEPSAAEKNITLTNRLGAPIPISGEKNLLNQAFANLIDNAIKFTPEGGAITISSEEIDGKTAIIVADSGPGVPVNLREKVFQKFFRLEQSRHTKGNGLGLSLVAAIARIHSADIVLEDNQPGLKVKVIFA